MDELHRHNKERWEELAAANVEWARPMLDLNADTARAEVDRYGVLGEVRGKNVLCLASGGGQQSAAFAVLGANVSVLDFSENQLNRDRLALEHYGAQGRLVQGDMRDLSVFEPASFDVVWHAFSINFVPDSGQMFDQVTRVLRTGGLYRMQWHNPFTMDTEESDWTGSGYLLKQRYRDGEIQFSQPDWVISYDDGTSRRVEGPREFNHTLSTVVNGLIGRGFALMGMWEERTQDPGRRTGHMGASQGLRPIMADDLGTVSGGLIAIESHSHLCRGRSALRPLQNPALLAIFYNTNRPDSARIVMFQTPNQSEQEYPYEKNHAVSVVR